jgi:hypothetical protein
MLWRSEWLFAVESHCGSQMGAQILICRNEAEKCLIEASINSLRISIKVWCCICGLTLRTLSSKRHPDWLHVLTKTKFHQSFQLLNCRLLLWFHPKQFSLQFYWGCRKLQVWRIFNTLWWYAIGPWEFCQTGAAHIGHMLLPSGEASRWAWKYIGQEVLTLFINASRVLSSPSSQTCAGRITCAISCINTLWLVIVQRNYAIIPSSAIRILTSCLPGYGCALW